jgi:hypothetical protein
LAGKPNETLKPQQLAASGSEQQAAESVVADKPVVSQPSTASSKPVALQQPQPSEIGLGKPTPAESEAYAAAERQRLGPLQSIVITSGDRTIVNFKTVGASTTGYLVVWKAVQTTADSLPDGSAAAGGIERSVGNGQEAHALLFSHKFRFGEYEVIVCQNLGGNCGMRSNVVYLTVAPVYDNCVPYPGSSCLIKGSSMAYRF